MRQFCCGDLEMNFERLLELREDNDLSQKDIAKMLKVSQASYSRWETGKEIIPLTKLNTLANYFSCSFDYLLKLRKTNNFVETKKLNKTIIGKRLLEVRNSNNITQRELADFLNTTSSTICAYEKGKTMILTAFAYQISKKYAVSMDWLCGREQ